MARTRRLLVLVAVLLVVAAIAVWQAGRHSSAASDPSPAGVASTSAAAPRASSATAAPRGTRTPTSNPTSRAQCAASGGSFVPTKFTIARLKVSVPVVSVDQQSSNGTMAPPVDQPWEVAWIDTTNKPGSSAPGVVDLTAHTYHAGGAIGNSLYSTNPLRPGDLIVLSDGSGHSACYRFTKETKFAAASYASTSTVFYDQQRSPQVRLMICWDYNRGTGDWDSRVVFYADPTAS